LKIYSCKISGDVSIVIYVVNDIIRRLQNTYGPIEEYTLFELKVILNELILNAIKHGNKNDCSKPIKVLAGLTKSDNAVVLVEDSGKGFDYNCIMNSNQDGSEIDDICNLKETGRGILIVKNLSNRMKYNYKGNRVIVIKKLYKK
jgi:serine/threonine-protein kinase RsbW